MNRIAIANELVKVARELTLCAGKGRGKERLVRIKIHPSKYRDAIVEKLNKFYSIPVIASTWPEETDIIAVAPRFADQAFYKAGFEIRKLAGSGAFAHLIDAY